MTEFQNTDPVSLYEVASVCASAPALVMPSETIVVPQTDEAEAACIDINKVHVNLEMSGLAFHVETQIPQNSQITELTARLEMATTMLRETQDKLERALTRVGFLEAQVLQRDQVIEQLCRNNRAG